VRTDSGVKGSISVYDMVDERIDEDKINVTDFLQMGMNVFAVVVGVNKQKFSVDLSIKPSHVK
jgi:translation initiation factor 2 alpha subunit (eIF-2alpha)